jgi:hypothetical protein
MKTKFYLARFPHGECIIATNNIDVFSKEILLTEMTYENAQKYEMSAQIIQEFFDICEDLNIRVE